MSEIGLTQYQEQIWTRMSERMKTMSQEETWTGEHKDIALLPGKYEYIPQMVFDPLSKRIEAAKD